MQKNIEVKNIVLNFGRLKVVYFYRLLEPLHLANISTIIHHYQKPSITIFRSYTLNAIKSKTGTYLFLSFYNVVRLYIHLFKKSRPPIIPSIETE